MDQPHIHLHLLSYELFFHSGYQDALSKVPFAIQYVFISYVFYNSINRVCMSIPISQFLLHVPFPLGIHPFVLYLCVSISALILALQIESSIPFF